MTCRRRLAELLGAYEGLRGYHLLPEGWQGSTGRSARPRQQRAVQLVPIVAGTHARGGVVAGAAAAGGTRRAEGFVSRRPARPGFAAGGFARAQFLAAAAGRGAGGGAARSAARQRHRAVHPQRAAQAADAAHAGTRQAHRQRLGGGGAVLPEVQDHAASAHEHGQGRAEHDDAHLGGGLSRRRHPHEQPWTPAG